MKHNQFKVKSFLVSCTPYCLVIVSVLFICSMAFAWQNTPLIDLNYLRPVDTLIIKISGSPSSNLLPIESIQDRKNYFSAIDEVLKSEFSAVPKLRIISCNPCEVSEIERPQALQFDFVISVKDEIFQGKHVKIGALALQITKIDHDDYRTAFGIAPVPYIFTVPDRPEQFYKELGEGVVYLTSYLPSYFLCADNNSDNSCNLAIPYNDKPLGNSP